MTKIIAGALFIYIFKETSRNACNNDSGDEQFQKNYFKYFGIRIY